MFTDFTSVCHHLDRYMPSSMGEPASLLLPSQGTAGMIPDCVPDSTSGSPFQHSFSITPTCNPSPPLQPTGPTAHHVGVNSSPPLQHVQNGYSPSLSPEHIHTLQPPCTDQPYLRFLEQPTNRIRYRYKSEKGSHGGLTGEFSTTTKKTYPTVKLENYQQHNSQVYIKAILYTIDDQPKPHVHKLMGKHCQDGVCTVTVGEDMVASFQNLGILFVGKKEVPDILYRRKLEDQNILSCLMQNGSTHFSVENEKHHLREEAEREAKDMDLNRVRIRFEAFAVSQGNSYPGHLYPISDAVYSNIIANQKCPDVGELKIVRMDKCSGLCTGSDEVFLLCEKVNKKDIKVMFFEEDENGMILWQDFGSFTEADVHHQVAIVFKTPPYRDPMIKFPVKVKLQLYRPRDRECSKPKDFVYIPVEHDREGIERKRRKVHNYQNFPGFDGGCNNFGSNHSFGTTGGSGSSGGNNGSFFGHGQGPVDFQGQNMLSTSQTRVTQSEEVPLSLREERKVNQELASGVSLSTEESLEASLHRLSLVDHDVRKSGSQKSKKLSGQVTSAPQSQYPSGRTSSKFLTQTREQCSSATTQETPPLLYKMTDTGGLNHLPKSTADSDTLDLRPVRQLALQMSLALREFICSGDLRKLLVTMRHLVAVQDTEGDNLLHLAIIHHAGNHTNQLVLVRCLLHVLKDLPKDTINQSNNLHQTPLMLAVMTKSPYIVQELLVHGANPNITDAEGNTPLHIATHNGDEICLSVLLDPKNHPDEVTEISSSLNKLNYAGFAPLHLAVKQGHKKCVKILCARGADINVMDGTSGHTPLHLAVVWSPHLIRNLLKMGHVDINAQNFAGNTTLHLACAYANEDVVSILVKAGASVLIENYDICSPNDQSGNESDVPNSKGKTPLDFSGNNHKMKKILFGQSSHSEDRFPNTKSSSSISKLSSSSVSDLKKSHDSKAEIGESKKSGTCTLAPFDSGYISGEIKTEDLDKMDLLFTELDKNLQWKQLGMTLGFEDSAINSIERLCSKDQSPAKAIIEKFQEEHPYCDLKETLTNALIAAALPEAVEIIH
ncbi:nuclear factor NF-kappa-B p105 subunit-like isoform X2 [Limulus polyphemus]|uniref:Nuclear factor NF-kappa-B p105 subunit-like isoform X2 n=1 Tax=Limulus polyphemus TaxID=6850 RepID=A0ABM1SYY8_LIMPO|nr:nuclear factor NF-kappa-B p105 subunit-like isoform X2 [Limulus polyphemus]